MEYKQRLKEVIEATVRKARQESKLAIFSIATTANINNQEVLFPALRTTDKTVCGNVMLTSEEYLEDIVREIDGVVDIILVDVETKVAGLIDLETKLRTIAKKSRVLTFRPNDLTVDAADTLIAQLMYPLKGKVVAIIGGGNIGSKLALKLVERNANVYLVRRDLPRLAKIIEGFNSIKSEYLTGNIFKASQNLDTVEKIDIIIGATPGTPAITIDMVRKMKKHSLIIDIGNGTIFPDAVEEARKRNIKVLCLVMKPGYDGMMETLLQTEKVVRNQKSSNFGNFSIISGGILGQRGDIIVDNADNPTEILAIADGTGDVISDLYDKEFQMNVSKVKSLIQERIK